MSKNMLSQAYTHVNILGFFCEGRHLKKNLVSQYKNTTSYGLIFLTEVAVLHAPSCHVFTAGSVVLLTLIYK